MKEYKCPKCNSADLFIQTQGNQIGLYCGDCGAWIKWVSKKEQPLVERFIRNHVKPVCNFIFTEDFANNWVAGQCVICESKDEGMTLVDGVALIHTEELMKHGYFENERTRIQGNKDVIKSKATELWQQLNESELPYDDFVEVQQFIINLFYDIN